MYTVRILRTCDRDLFSWMIIITGCPYKVKQKNPRYGGHVSLSITSYQLLHRLFLVNYILGTWNISCQAVQIFSHIDPTVATLHKTVNGLFHEASVCQGFVAVGPPLSFIYLFGSSIFRRYCYLWKDDLYIFIYIYLYIDLYIRIYLYNFYSHYCIVLYILLRYITLLTYASTNILFIIDIIFSVSLGPVEHFQFWMSVAVCQWQAKIACLHNIKAVTYFWQ